MSDWIEANLRDDHTWSARPGCKIFVADRGSLRFDYPQTWVVIPGEHSINFHDRQPPDDDVHLEVSIMRLPPADWSGLPLRNLIPAAISGDHRDLRSRGEIQEATHGDVEIAWMESVFIDKQEEEREAHSSLSRSQRKHSNNNHYGILAGRYSAGVGSMGYSVGNS